MKNQNTKFTNKFMRFVSKNLVKINHFLTEEKKLNKSMQKIMAETGSNFVSDYFKIQN